MIIVAYADRIYRLIGPGGVASRRRTARETEPGPGKEPGYAGSRRTGLHLAAALDGAGWHPAGWREPGARPADLFTPGYWADLAAEAERGLLDFATIEDALGLQAASRYGGPDDRADQVRGRRERRDGGERVKFLAITLITHTPDPVTGAVTSTTARLREVIDNAVLAEQLGLDGFGVGERHERPFISSSPPVVLSHAAARTSVIRLLVSADVVVAEDDATARELAAPYGLWVRSIRSGEGAIPFPGPAEAAAHTWTGEEEALVADRVATQFVGSPATVAKGLRVLQDATGADEILVTTITHDHADRVRSLELLAREWGQP